MVSDDIASANPEDPVGPELGMLPDPLLGLGSHSLWASASAWLNNIRVAGADTRACELAKECWMRIRLIPHDCIIPGFSNAIALSTRCLAAVLGRAWLDDDIVNAGGEWIMTQLGDHSSVQIVNCLLPGHLTNMRLRCSVYAPSKPRRLDTRIRSGELHTLFIPLHVHGNHWTLCTINISQRTFMYVDSRDANACMPARDRSVLSWWLESLLPGDSFEVIPANFCAPSQTDSNSCGVVVISIMAHILLGLEEWSQTSADVFRMEWFLRLSGVYDAGATVSFYLIDSRFHRLTGLVTGPL